MAVVTNILISYQGLSRLVKKMGYKESFFGVHDDRTKRDFISAGWDIIIFSVKSIINYSKYKVVNE